MNYLDRPITRRELAEAIDAAMDANRKGEDRDLPHLAAELRREPEATPAISSATRWATELRAVEGRAEAAEARERVLMAEAAQLRIERGAAASAAGQGCWVWSDTDPNDLASMSDGMLVRMRAAQLRALLAERPAPAPAPAGVGWVVRREADYYVAHTALSVECDTACGQCLVGAALVPAELGERDTKLNAWHQEQRSAGSRRPLRRCAECALRCRGVAVERPMREVQGEWAVVLERPAYATKQAWVAHAATHVLDPAARVDHSELVKVQCRTEPVRAEARVNEREFGIGNWAHEHQEHELVFCPECNRVRPVPR